MRGNTDIVVDSGHISVPGGHRHPPEAAGDGDHPALRLSDQREDGLHPGQEPDHVDLQRLPVGLEADPLDLTKCCPASVINDAP